LDKYNRIKAEHAGDAGNGYWQAKHAFFSELMNSLRCGSLEWPNNAMQRTRDKIGADGKSKVASR
jgi:hypothetical protein